MHKIIRIRIDKLTLKNKLSLTCKNANNKNKIISRNKMRNCVIKLRKNELLKYLYQLLFKIFKYCIGATNYFQNR